MKIWMKLSCLAIGALPLFCSGADASQAENWSCISSGKMTVAADVQTGSVKFTVTFPDTQKDRWAYPRLNISEGDAGASKLSFQIKVETSPKQEKYKNLIVMLNPANKEIKKNWLSYALPVSDEFQTITLNLNQTAAYEKSIQIGLNFMNADKAIFYIRNVKFE